MTHSSGAQKRVARAVTGMVAGGYAISYDLSGGAVPCSQCDRPLGAGDDVTAAVACYEGHTWEPYGIYCKDHDLTTIESTMGQKTDEQAVIAATLEPAGYMDPLGDNHPDAVSFGGIEVCAYSPMSYEVEE